MSELKYRLYDGKLDYRDISEWWKRHKWPVIPQSSLPSVGVVVFEGQVKCCAVFLYKSDSDIMWLEWMVTNPDSGLKARVKAMKISIKCSIDLAKTMGARVIFSSLGNKNLVKMYCDLGFDVSDKSATNLLARLK